MRAAGLVRDVGVRAEGQCVEDLLDLVALDAGEEGVIGRGEPREG